MTVSVVIPAHGRAELLVHCLRSLSPERQGNIGAEICVVDDGSGLDEKQIRDGIPFPLIWRAFPSPRGRSVARNEGVRATSAELVIFLDSDMEAREGFLAAHLAAHLAHPRTAAIGRIVWPYGGSFLRYIGSRGIAKLSPGDPVPPWYFVTGNASVERRDLPGDAPFDETVPGWGGEDLDLGLALAWAGVGFAYAPDAAADHHFTGNLSAHLERTFSYGRDSLPVLVKKHPDLPGILRLDLLESWLWRIAVSGSIYRLAAALARTFDALLLPAALYDYLTFAAYARGWLEKTKR
jgi:glycosyltransferase involved in cell wall biosynthesis